MIKATSVCAIAFALGSIMAPSEARAEEDPKACAAIQNDGARLECYDLIFRKSEAVVPTTSWWAVKEEISKIDDSTNAYLYLESATTYSDRFGHAKDVTLVIACHENETNLYFVFDDFMSDNQGAGKITYRVDKTPAKTKEFAASTDNHALGLWNGSNAINFVKELFGASNLLIRARPYSESAIQVEFPIAGLEEAIKPLRKACSW